MSNYVEKCEKHVESERHRRRDMDCISSSGGSEYQELICRHEEMIYSTDDEFIDATETIRSPLLSGDQEDQLSAPILKQLQKEKEETRYTVAGMLTDTESVNNTIGHNKQTVETVVEKPCGKTISDDPIRPEKNKCSRTLRLPSTVAMPTVGPDRTARGDGRPPVGVSKIPIPVSSITKLQLIRTAQEQNTPEIEAYQTLELSTSFVPEPPKNSKPPSENRTPSKPSTRPSSRSIARPSPPLTQENRMDTDNKNHLVISKDAEPPSHEKPRIKRPLSQNRNIEGGLADFTPVVSSLVCSTNEGGETKRLCVANKLPSREEPEKHFNKTAEPVVRDPEKRKREIQAIRNRLGKERCLINTKERTESAFRKSDNGASQIPINVRPSSSRAGSEKNLQSPRQLSPHGINTTLMEKRHQWRQSRESVNGDQKTSTRNSNMPEIKPPLFKSNQRKSNQLGQRHQENLPNAPMKSALENESLRRKNALTEKRKMTKKQKEATNMPNKPVIGDDVAQQVGKSLERASREKPPLIASQKGSSSDIRKPPTGVKKSAEKITSSHSNFAKQDIQKESAGVDAKDKPSDPSANLKSALASMHNVYKIHYKRFEEQLSEVKRSEDKLRMSSEKLKALRSQMIQKFGEDVEEFTPPLHIVQYVEQNSPTVLTTARGMNTDALASEVAEPLVLGNIQQLKQGIDNIRMDQEEAKGTENANKKDDDSILGPKQRIRDMSLTLTLVEKRKQTLEDEMKEKEKEIATLINENKQMNDSIRQRDQHILALRKQIEEKNNELESIYKKLTESENNLKQEAYKVEVHRVEYQKLMEEKNRIEYQFQEMGARYADFEEREECLNTMFEKEKKNSTKLEQILLKKEEELNLMAKKFFQLEASSSNMKVNADQLQEKETIIGELEIMKTSLQVQIRELCCLLSDMFALKGIEYNTDQIQASLSSGSFIRLREKLIQVMEEPNEEGNKALNEAKSKIVELQNQVEILEIELKNTKEMSDRLTNVITHQKPWDTNATWEEDQRSWSTDMVSARHHNLIESSVCDGKSLTDRNVHSLMPSIDGSFVYSESAMASNNNNDLFVLLEVKRRQLLQLERQYQDMKKAHSRCPQKNTRNEARIARLEYMLATSHG